VKPIDAFTVYSISWEILAADPHDLDDIMWGGALHWDFGGDAGTMPIGPLSIWEGGFPGLTQGMTKETRAPERERMHRGLRIYARHPVFFPKGMEGLLVLSFPEVTPQRELLGHVRIRVNLHGTTAREIR
jgi:hypothetical protein